MKVVNVAEMRAIEKAADASGVTYADMMEAAGRSVAEAILNRLEVKGRRILVLVGPGNNGGDGLVAARYLVEAGATVSAYLLKPRDEKDINYRRLRESGNETGEAEEAPPQPFIVDAEDDQRGRVLHQLVTHTDVVVDALLGTGSRLPLEGALADLLTQVKRGLKEAREKCEAERPRVRSLVFPAPRLNEHCPMVVAVDLPTGLNADTGEVDPNTLNADLTVTFAAPKIGQLRFPGASAVGELLVADIGVPPDLPALREVSLELADTPMVRGWLPARPKDANKGTFGKVLVVGGSSNYTGAAFLAGVGAYRVGAGLVTLAVPWPLQPAMASLLPEATFLLLPHDMGVLNTDAVKVLTKDKKLEDYQTLLLGPGLGREQSTAEFMDALIGISAHARKRTHMGFRAVETRAEETEEDAHKLPPLVVDADGLNLLAEMDEWWKRLPSGTILTPHPGEMARLMKAEIATIQADRVRVARQQAAEWGHIIVLKGAFTVVADPNGQTVLLPFANPGLARAGTGDVLSGAIAGLLAQGLKPFQAAVAGAFLHGLAGELSSEDIGPASTIAGDVVRYLPDAVQVVEERQ